MDINLWLKENTSWINVLKDLGIFSIAAFFIQRIINSSADRKLERYKQELDLQSRQYQSILDLSVEKFKGEIAIHSSQQNSLHERHLTIIHEMYMHLVELDSAMRNMTALIKPVYNDAEKEDQERIDRAQNAFKKYNNFFLFHKLYFKKDVCHLLEKIRKDYFSANWDYFEPKRLASFTGGKPTQEGYKDAVRIANEASRKVTDEIPKTLDLLEIEFKKILGVE